MEGIEEAMAMAAVIVVTDMDTGRASSRRSLFLLPSARMDMLLELSQDTALMGMVLRMAAALDTRARDLASMSAE